MSEYRIQTTSAEETENLAAQLGARLQGGEVFEMVSDLGGGKTTFTRGLVRGAGSTDKVASPTFTISKEYRTPKFTIAHFDFYRLEEAGIVADELAEFISDPSCVCIVEWGDVVHDVLPEARITIQLNRAAGGDDNRELICIYPETLSYLFEDLA